MVIAYCHNMRRVEVAQGTEISHRGLDLLKMSLYAYYMHITVTRVNFLSNARLSGLQA